MLKHTKGNLIDLAERGKFDIIVHGCNCQNTMGSGIAKEIRERYPESYIIDTEYHKTLAIDYGEPFVFEKLGNYTECVCNDEKFTIINAYTQLHYLPRGIDHFEYDSFNLILRKLAVRFPDSRFGFPHIGMGLAGGDSGRIFSMLEWFASLVEKNGGTVTVVDFDGNTLPTQ